MDKLLLIPHFLHTLAFPSLLCISCAVHLWLIKSESLQVKFQPWLVGFMACKGKCSLPFPSTFLKLECISGLSLPLVGMASLVMQSMSCCCCRSFCVSLMMLHVFSKDLASLWCDFIECLLGGGRFFLLPCSYALWPQQMATVWAWSEWYRGNFVWIIGFLRGCSGCQPIDILPLSLSQRMFKQFKQSRTASMSNTEKDLPLRILYCLGGGRPKFSHCSKSDRGIDSVSWVLQQRLDLPGWVAATQNVQLAAFRVGLAVFYRQLSDELCWGDG